MSKKATKTALMANRLAPKKRFGQNFLVHAATAEAIVACADLQTDDVIVEVGVGLGALTIHLARRVARVIGVEIDSGLVRYHHDSNTLPDNVTLVHGDVLDLDFPSLAGDGNERMKIMANLPYSISNPFIFKLIDNSEHVDWALIMLQKEVAQRLTAQPSTKDYGIPTVLLASCATIRKHMHLSPHAFHPQPKIDSVVVEIVFTQTPSGNGVDCSKSFFTKVVRASFSKRRKTLLNNLATAPFWADVHGPRPGKEEIAAAIHLAGLDPRGRAEDMSTKDFFALAAELEKVLGDN